MDILKKRIIISDEEQMRRVKVDKDTVEEMFRCLKRVLNREKSNGKYLQGDVAELMDDVRATVKKVTDK